MKSFIPDKTIEEILKANKKPESPHVKEILEKARGLKGLTPEETAALLQCDDREIIEAIFEAASAVKESIYGKRLVIFAPLYLSNFCINNCAYCGFRKDNTTLKKKRLSLNEIKKEVEYLEGQGQKRLLLIAGEDPQLSKIETLTGIIETVYKTKKEAGSIKRQGPQPKGLLPGTLTKSSTNEKFLQSNSIRRLNVNVAPMSVKNFRVLKKSGIGTYQLFQETYHQKTYNKLHTDGPKADYISRLFAMDRAQEAGIDDVGIGALFGLYDYRFEVLALVYHSLHLEKQFGAGPHTISIPRLKPALNATLSPHNPYAVPDEDFKKLVAILRLAVPYTGMILSTRENAVFREELFSIGISQISAGSRNTPGAYSEENVSDAQFKIEDNRTLHEVIKDMIQKGYLPSFCTACYRVGRTGQDFMDIAKPGDIKNFCVPNSLLTFKEYVLDYGEKELQKQANDAIKKELADIPYASMRKNTEKKLEQMEKGERDLYF